MVALAGAGAARAADEAPPDICGLAKAADIVPLITPRTDVDLRSASMNPEPGKFTCDLSAVQRGLTDDAPPEGRLSLARYHIASAERASLQMRRLASARQTPSLVRTDEPQDQVLRPDADTVIARHGNDIVVLDASATRDLVRQKAGWTYGLEALALAVAGAHVLGPVDQRAKAPLCDLVAHDRVLALLTLSPSTLEASRDGDDDGLRCYFNVKDASREPGAWVDNRGTAQFRREDLGTNEAALARLHSDRPFYKPSTDVITEDPTDRVVPSPDHPEEVEAVHGPFLVTLNLTDVTPAARAAPGWAYRVQRTALEAAGATIRPKAGMPPDPIVPGPPPPPAAFAWRNSGHQAPPWAAFSDPVLHVLAFVARNRFYMMPVLILLAIVMPIARSTTKQRPSAPAVIGFQPDPPSRTSRAWMLTLLLIGFAIFNLVFGTWMNTELIHAFGAEGRATITGSHGTSTVYNDHNVRGYDVLLKTADGKVVETSFEDDDFNVYPHHNATRYPGEGDEFNVRYLTHFPTDFVILGEDDSPWAHGVHCSRLAGTRSEAEAKLHFASDVAAYRDAFEAAVKAEHDAGCGE